ncbi:hypothetical protein Tco_0367446 [Tanacetum coccineum]
MVACLERTDGNANFHEIVDFLTTSPIHYALTSEGQIHSTVDGKTVVSIIIISKGVYFSLNDEDEQIPVTESSSPKNIQTARQALQEDTQLPHTSVPIPNVADEVIFKEWDDRVVRATTTAASLDAAHASGNITKTQSTTMSNDHLSQEIGLGDRPRGYTLGSDEGRPEFHELMAICTTLSDKVLDLEKEKDAQAVDLNFDDTTAAEKDVNAAEPVSTAGDAVTAASVIPDIDTAGPSNVSAAGPSTSTAGDIFEDEMMTIADTLVAIRSTRPRTTLVLREREQRIARERATKQEAKDADLIAEFDNVQARIEADALQKLEDATEKEGLKAYLKIVPDENKAVNYETLATKYPIVDWVSQIIGSDLQGNDLSYWKITRADGSSKFYKVFSMMLEDFDRQDLVDLHRLVKEKSASRALEGYDLILWGDLKTMFEPSKEDDVWRNQQD